MRIDTVRLELGYGLLCLAGGDAPRLTEQIKSLRRSIAAEMGFVLPPVRIQDNLELEADAYSIRLKEIEAGKGELRPTMLMVMDPGGALPDIQGERTTEPAFGLPAIWIEQTGRDEAILRGCTVVDPASVLTTHLTEIVRDSMAELLSYARNRQTAGRPAARAAEAGGGADPRADFHRRGPARAAIPAGRTRQPEGLADHPGRHPRGLFHRTARDPRLGRACPHPPGPAAQRLACRGPGGAIPLVTLSPEWEAIFAESLVGPAEDRQLAIPPSRLGEFMQRFRTVFETPGAEGAVLLCSGGIRAHVRAIVERLRPSTPVLAQSEIFPRARIRTVGTI